MCIKYFYLCKKKHIFIQELQETGTFSLSKMGTFLFFVVYKTKHKFC